MSNYILNVSVPICCTTYVATPPPPHVFQQGFALYMSLGRIRTITRLPMTPPEGFESEYQSNLSRGVHITTYGPDGPVPEYRLLLCVLVIPCGTVTVDLLRS